MAEEPFSLEMGVCHEENGAGAVPGEGEQEEVSAMWLMSLEITLDTHLVDIPLCWHLQPS